MIFCTLFDSNYMSRGLVTYYSLEKVCPDFHLYIFAFDSTSFKVLTDLKLKHATIISLEEFEDEDLLRIKPTRSAGEYCWTATSSTIKYVLEKFNAPHCTYIDADLFFYENPQVLIDELGESDVSIISHRYTPRYDQSATSGKYCVQFMTFRNTEQGKKVLEWWRNACLDWCYNRFEDGKFGDQKYLDDWNTRFAGIVKELHHEGGGVAPWNIQQYEVSGTLEKPFISSKSSGKTFPVIFYHFHQFKVLTEDRVDLCRYVLSDNDVEMLYAPYVKELMTVSEMLQQNYPGKDYNATYNPSFTWKTPLVWLKRKIRNEYNIFDRSEITR